MNDEDHSIPARPETMGGSVRWTDTERTEPSFEGDVQALEADLEAALRGEVRFDGGSKGAYSTDASNYRQVPIGVVIPRDTDDMVAAVRVCHEHGAPITHRGAGTGLAGQSVNTAVIIDCSKYLDEIIEVDPERKLARVQPGVRRDQLAEVTEQHNLTFGPDTSTHEYATFGGMIGNNACGIHSQMSGRTEDNIREMEVLTYDGVRMRVGPTSEEELERIIQQGGRRGEIYRALRDLRDEYADEIRERSPDIPRRVSGYNLVELLPENDFNLARALVGTEGTCATILEATVELVPSPPERVVLALGYPDVAEAGRHVSRVGASGAIGLEGMDDVLIEDMSIKGLHARDVELLPEGGGYLLAEFGGDTKDEALQQARRLMAELEEEQGTPAMHLFEDEDDQRRLWQVREAGLAATAHVPQRGDAWPGWEDSAVPPERIGDYMEDLYDLYEKYGYRAALYGHFGQGCVHTRINFNLRTAEGLDMYRQFMDEASDLCMQYGGSLSAEHGDGQARAELLPKMYGAELMEAFRTFKEIWDPDWKMNPGKVIDPFRIDDNLRLGTDYSPPDLETHFQFPEDDGSFAQASLRCVGVGKCRRLEMSSDDVMCPSFLATKEEKHTTRGRARLLFEMLNGEETPAAWDNDDVHEALDLCLSCKGCKNDCPVNVDMATYKSEFLSHYYEENRRPRQAYAFGLIHWWSRLASLMPNVANFFSQTPGLSTVLKAVGGVAQERTMPPFAEQTFRQWFHERGSNQQETAGNSEIQNPKPKIPNRVLLWPDTFTNFFKPNTGKAAVEVLEDAGCQVVLPEQMLCCGRPLYEYGMLDTAKHLWRQILEALREEIRAGTPLVGLEPSCVAAFRDELGNLFPHDQDAERLAGQTFTLEEFLTEQLEDYEPPTLPRKALVHGHCHHKSIMGTDTQHRLLDQMEVDYEVPAASCCGMAGAFGFEAEHYDVSIQCGEHELLPAVREAEKDTLIITDGFSCREQIEQTTDRRALHLAEALHLALREDGADADYPEHPYLDRMRMPEDRTERVRQTGWLAAGAFAAGTALSFLGSR